MLFARWNRIFAIGLSLIFSRGFAFGQESAPGVLRLPTALRVKADPKDKEKDKAKEKADAEDKEAAKKVWQPWKPTGKPMNEIG